MPSLSVLPDMSVMSLVNAAWAIVLSRISGDLDVVYGSLVAGRNSDLEGVQTVVGPCINMVPVRVNLSSVQTLEDLLHSIQEQLYAMGEADSLHQGDIIQYCTDWPAGSILESEFQHLSYDLDVDIQSNGSLDKVNEFNNPYRIEPCSCIQMQTYSAPLQIDLWTNTHLVSPHMADAVVEEFYNVISGLADNLGKGVLLRYWMRGLQAWVEDIGDKGNGVSVE